MSKVCLEKCEDYNVEKLTEIFRRSFISLGINKKIKPGMTVVIKPNLVMKTDPESGIITHPNVTAAVGTLVKDLGANVLIAESSGGIYTEQSVKSVMDGCGYTSMAKKYGFEIYNKCENRAVELKEGVICKTLNVVEPFINADFIIDIAKLKSHCMTMLSGAVKNLFGTVPGLMKPELHFRYPDKKDFSTMLVDLCQFITPDLSIIDAVDAMEGDGPTGGTKTHVGCLIVSDSPYYADLTASEIIGIEPMDVLMLTEANRRGLCPEKVSPDAVEGASISECKAEKFQMPRSKDVDFANHVPKFLRPAVRKITTPRPVINTKKCVGCGKCAESCPRHTIKIENRKAVIDYSQCIRCFCCHEMCPKHIIEVKRFSFFKF